MKLEKYAHLINGIMHSVNCLLEKKHAFYNNDKSQISIQGMILKNLQICTNK